MLNNNISTEVVIYSATVVKTVLHMYVVLVFALKRSLSWLMKHKAFTIFFKKTLTKEPALKKMVLYLQKKKKV